MDETDYANDAVVVFGFLPVPADSDPTPDGPKLRRCLVIRVDEEMYTSRPFLFVNLYWYEGFSSIPLGKAKLILRPKDSKDLINLNDRRVRSFTELRKNVDIAALFIGNRRVYRELLKAAGNELAKRVLLRASELAALHAFHSSSRALKQIRSSGFLEGVISSDEEQFSFLSLRKLMEEDQRRFPPDIERIHAVVEISPRKLLTVNLQFYEALRTVQPLTVVIGANGVGKTRLLIALARAIMGKGGNGATVFERDGTPASLKGFSPISFTYEKTLWGSLARAGARVIALGVASGNWRSLGRLLQSLALADKDDFSIKAFCRVVSDVVAINDMHIPTVGRTSLDAGGAQPSIRLIDLSNGPSNEILAAVDAARDVYFESEDKGRYHPSSGQRSVLLFTAHLYAEASNGALILIDEPENHLHPQFVSIMMQTLRRTLVATESRAVVVTHSPFVVREVDNSAVLILGKDENAQPALYRTTLQTLGADVSAISDHIFRDSEVKKAYERRIDEILSEATSDLERSQLIEEVEAEVGRDAEIYVRLRAAESSQ